VNGSGTGGRLVRPFALVGGRTQPSRADFTLITLVTTVDPQPAPVTGLQPEHLMILRRCRVPTAAAEIAAHLDLPFSVVTIMLCDLLDDGRITTARPPVQASGSPDRALLQKVRDGIARL
jgi:hypothetical protein